MVLMIAPLIHFMNSHVTINSKIIRNIVMNVKLRVCRASTLRGKNRASLIFFFLNQTCIPHSVATRYRTVTYYLLSQHLYVDPARPPSYQDILASFQ
jgi:hypothetical protein